MKKNNFLLEVVDLCVKIDETPILKGISFFLNDGELVALMGPNGSGKSTLASVLMGHPKYVVGSGKVLFAGKDILLLSPDKRAKLGLFLSFQYPSEIQGVSVSNFLRTAFNSLHPKEKFSPIAFSKLLKENMSLLGIPVSFASRSLNEGFSGGEKKRMEILQLLILKPKLAILDETDSGLDVDALKAVANGVNVFRAQNPKTAVLVITHYTRILNYLSPSRVLVMGGGRIVKSGSGELAEELERTGYVAD